MHGLGPFRQALEEKLALTRWATAELHSIPGIEILAEPQLSIVAFRLAPTGLDTPALNQLNQQFLQRINARKNVLLSGTMLGDRFAIRICILSFRTHRDRVQTCLDDISGCGKS